MGQSQLLNQKKTFTHQDSLRGTLNENRSWFDVLKYTLEVDLNIGTKTINGICEMEYHVTHPHRTMQLDLFAQYEIQEISKNGANLKYKRDGNAILIEMTDMDEPNSKNSIKIVYSGVVHTAVKAPWDGGFVFSHDSDGVDWIGVACEGFGASSWWPCKDHLSDEPEQMIIKLHAPKGLKAIANGRLVLQEQLDKTDRFTWEVKNPINTYNVNMSIGNYVNFNDTFQSKVDGDILNLSYWVLEKNLDKAKKQFQQVKPMLICYEEKLGKYPFYEDGYKLVETPYLGMEHQSCIAYGNGYKEGYAGNTKMTNGYPFDYIIVHESGHEWFGNNISCADIADMWIHEAFTTYSESIFVEYYYGKEKGNDYINSKFGRIGNKAPIQGVYGVNEEGAGDMYAKGSLFLNTLRGIINNDSLWWTLIKKMNVEDFRHKTTDYAAVQQFFSSNTGLDLSKIFQQYIQHPQPPVLFYEIDKEKGKKHTIKAFWKTDVKGFEMPIEVSINSKKNERMVFKSDEATTFNFKGKIKDLKFNQRNAYYLTEKTIQKK